jgi:hypothetical protein
MARTRNLKPSFFKNEFLAECEPMARLLFAGLWCLADCEGRMECRPLRIKAELFPYDNCDIRDLLGQLQAHGFIDIYEVDGVQLLEIPTFAEHQRCHPSEGSKSLPAREKGDAVIFHGEPGKKTANCALYPNSFNPNSSNPLDAPSKPTKRRTSSKPVDPLRWSAENGWEGITDADHAEWSQAYPAADLPVELAKANQWLKANPKKATKSNWRRWLTTVWLSKCQDRGGTHREAANRPGSVPVDNTKRKYWRGDAARSMTDEQYAAWKKSQRAPSEVRQLAATLRISPEK